MKNNERRIFINKVSVGSHREPFLHPFGFKGNALSGVLQTVVGLEAEGERGIGLGIQSVLWSDSAVFCRYGEAESDRLMLSVTEYAAGLVRGKSFSSPDEILDFVLPPCLEYAEGSVGQRVTETFVLNALVPLDMAAWQLFARLDRARDFEYIFDGGRREERLANVPLITYGTPVSEVVRMAGEGVCLFKIKLGSDPDGDRDPEKMLAWDKARALELHNALSVFSTPYTENGNIAYYFDANGRYDTRERLTELTDFLADNGIADNTLLFEEPFAPDNKLSVEGIPLCFAADESVHSLADLKERIALGYRAITLKPIAKTLSLSRRMAEEANKAGIQCFCADLTVNPLMVEWNKNFAARLSPINGMRIGIVESNGGQNYVNWETMKGYVPRSTAESDATVYTLDDEFYENAGGIYLHSPYYLSLLGEKKEVNDE